MLLICFFFLGGGERVGFCFFFWGLILLSLFLLGTLSLIELKLTACEMKCHFVMKGCRTECSFKLHEKLNCSVSQHIGHLWLAHTQACTSTFTNLVSRCLLFSWIFMFILKCKHKRIWFEINFFIMTSFHSDRISLLKLIKTSQKSHVSTRAGRRSVAYAEV